MKTLFYSEKLGDDVVASLCKCGHLEQNHGSLCHHCDHVVVREAHGGNCCVSNCECLQFQWERWVTRTEYDLRFVTTERDGHMCAHAYVCDKFSDCKMDCGKFKPIDTLEQIG